MENRKMKIILMWFAIVFGIYLLLLFPFFQWRDTAIEKSAEKYSACILQEYQQTPEACREANGGVYCECK